jgi:protein-S-isoprenylcysteine O-methyltransferase Ste14
MNKYNQIDIWYLILTSFLSVVFIMGMLYILRIREEERINISEIAEKLKSYVKENNSEN